MEKLEIRAFKSDNTENQFYSNLFDLFTNSLPVEFLETSKIIPFSIVRLVLSWYRLDKKEASLVMRKWAQLKLVEIVKFKGIKIRLNGNLNPEGESDGQQQKLNSSI
jgi:hypothetical protein